MYEITNLLCTQCMTLWTSHLSRAHVQLALNWTISMFYQQLKTRKETKNIKKPMKIRQKSAQDFTWWIMHQIGRIEPQHPPCTVGVLMERWQISECEFSFLFWRKSEWSESVLRYLNITKPSQNFIVDLLVRFSRWYRMCFDFRDVRYNAARHTRYVPAIVRRSILNHVIACVMCCAE